MKLLSILCLFLCSFTCGSVQSEEILVTVDVNYFQAERFLQGEVDAQKYIKAGKAKIFISGGSMWDLPIDRRRNEMRMKALKQSGIEFELSPGDGCIPDPGGEAYARGFEKVMRPNLDSLLGKDWEKKIENEVDSLMKSKERKGRAKVLSTR